MQKQSRLASSSAISPPTAIPATVAVVSPELGGDGEACADGVGRSVGGDGVVDGGDGAAGVPGAEGGGREGVAGVVPDDGGGAAGVAGGGRGEEGGGEEAGGAGGEGGVEFVAGGAVRFPGGEAGPGAAGGDDIRSPPPVSLAYPLCFLATY